MLSVHCVGAGMPLYIPVNIYTNCRDSIAVEIIQFAIEKKKPLLRSFCCIALSRWGGVPTCLRSPQETQLIMLLFPARRLHLSDLSEMLWISCHSALWLMTFTKQQVQIPDGYAAVKYPFSQTGDRATAKKKRLCSLFFKYIFTS